MSIDLVVLIAVLASVIMGLFYLLIVYIFDRSVRIVADFARYHSFLIITLII